jgi:hypothetical protein
MLCDSEIKELIENHGFIQNYNPASYADLPISAGISSVGYDLTLAASVYSITEPGTLDPLNFQEHSLTLLPVKKHNGRDVVFIHADLCIQVWTKVIFDSRSPLADRPVVPLVTDPVTNLRATERKVLEITVETVEIFPFTKTTDFDV